MRCSNVGRATNQIFELPLESDVKNLHSLECDASTVDPTKPVPKSVSKFGETEADESGIWTTANMKPSEVKKDPSALPLSKEGRKIFESHSAKPKPVSNFRSHLERCQREVKRTISGGNLIAKMKEPVGQTKSLPLRSVYSDRRYLGRCLRR